MKATALSLVVLIVTIASSTGAVGDSVSVKRHLISTRGSERATTGIGNKIITHKGKTHVAWLESVKAGDDGFVCLIRTLDRSTRTWSRVFTIGPANGNHGRPAITIDSRGYLHAVFGMHHDSIPYRKTVRPNDPSEWTSIERFPSKLSYPALLCGPDDTLFLTGRLSWDGVALYVKRPGQPWEGRGLIVRRNEDCFSYAAFHGGLAWGPDHKTLHYSCSVYQGKSKSDIRWGSIQSVNYMRSKDYGRTWQRTDGTQIDLPATAATMDVLAAGESLEPKPGIRSQGSIVVDSNGNPYVLYHRSSPEKPADASLVTTDDNGKWRHLPLQTALDEHYPGWALVNCRAGLTMTEDDVLCLAVNLIRIDHPRARWDGKPGSKYYHQSAEWADDYLKDQRIVWLESRDLGKTWSHRNLLEFDPKTAHLQPSLERPTGFNRIPAGTYPGLLYFDGELRNARPDEVIDNKVYFVEVLNTDAPGAVAE